METLNLPETLWREDAICMRPILVKAWREELQVRDLYDRACSEIHPGKEVFGGENPEETRLHFADRFKTSSARVAFVVLGPEGNFPQLPRNLLAALFDGSTAILDIPCGSGGGLHGLLSSAYELRLRRNLPRTPINVRILAGDCSQLALEIHASMLQRVRDDYSAIGIRLDWSHKVWDATDPLSTSALLDTWLDETRMFEEHLVFVSAFSGFAKQNLDDILDAVRQIAVRPQNKMLQLAWIEPDMNETKRLMPKVFEVIMNIFRRKVVNAAHYAKPVEFSYLHPFTNARIRGRARVIAFEKSILQ